MTTYRHFEVELAEVKRLLVGMGDLVERMLQLGIAAILHPTVESRDQLSAVEAQVDDLQDDIEERCQRLIALQSPMAKDLRFLIAALRIAGDLEQVGDLTEGLGKRATYIARHHSVRNPPEMIPLSELCVRMVHQAMEAFVSGDIELAKQILIEEDQADELTKQSYKSIQGFMVADVSCIKEYTHLLRAVGHLEHVADIAVAIAEEAVYIHRGTMIRHQHLERLTEG
jgi:phosphate transport system protein